MTSSPDHATSAAAVCTDGEMYENPVACHSGAVAFTLLWMSWLGSDPIWQVWLVVTEAIHQRFYTRAAAAVFAFDVNVMPKSMRTEYYCRRCNAYVLLLKRMRFDLCHECTTLFLAAGSLHDLQC